MGQLYLGSRVITPIITTGASNLQSKTLTVGQSTATTTTVTPDSNYDGLSSVTVDLSEIEALLTEINGE